MEKLLEYQGYEAIQAEGGAEALALLEEKPADLVLLDIKMPRMDGLEVLQRIRDNDAEMPVVMIFINKYTTGSREV